MIMYNYGKDVRLEKYMILTVISMLWKYTRNQRSDEFPRKNIEW